MSQKVDVNGNPSADQAAGCVACLSCVSYPEVWRTPGSRKYNKPARWNARCKVCRGEYYMGDTRTQVVALWNQDNARLRII